MKEDASGSPYSSFSEEELENILRHSVSQEEKDEVLNELRRRRNKYYREFFSSDAPIQPSLSTRDRIMGLLHRIREEEKEHDRSLLDEIRKVMDALSRAKPYKATDSEARAETYKQEKINYSLSKIHALLYERSHEGGNVHLINALVVEVDELHAENQALVSQNLARRMTADHTSPPVYRSMGKRVTWLLLTAVAICLMTILILVALLISSERQLVNLRTQQESLVNEKNAELSEMKGVLNKTNNTINDLNNQLGNANTRIADLEQQLDNSNRQINTLKQHLANQNGNTNSSSVP